MFQTHANAVALGSFDEGCSHHPGDHRVLGVIFVVASAEWIALDVDGGCQENVDAVGFHLLAHGFAHFIGKLRVPGRSKDGACREGRGVVTVTVTCAKGVDTQSRRAVGHDDSRDTETGNGKCGAGSTGHDAAYTPYHRAVAVADEHAGTVYEV